MNNSIDNIGKPDGKGRSGNYEESENLGLDADHSSVSSRYAYLNNDNDRISHNPDGESDDSDTNEERGHSPLMDK